MHVTCIGVAVKNLNNVDVSKFETKTSSDKTLIGVPFNSGIPLTNVRNYLLGEGLEETDIIGNFTFISINHVVKSPKQHVRKVSSIITENAESYLSMKSSPKQRVDMSSVIAENARLYVNKLQFAH